MPRKHLAISMIALFLVLFFVFDLHAYLSLEAIKSRQLTLQHLLIESPASVISLFMLVYIITTALSIPGAAILTLLAGALFGIVWGTVVVSFASTIGATLAFLISRWLLRDWIESRYGQRFASINEGIQKEGGFYLFTLRLVPVVPFFLINLLMGLTKIRTWTFFWVSQLGMLAGTLVYVQAGTQLGKLESASGLFAPGLLASFTLLGIFPLLAKKVVTVIKRRRAFKGWQRPKRFDRNLVVIGAGAAGLVSAYIAAAVKAKVTLIEKHKMGGDCLNYGCVPSKALIKAAKVAHTIRKAHTFGIHAIEPSIDFKGVFNHVKQAIKRIEPHDSIERYSTLGVEVIQGQATITSPWSVDVKQSNGTTLTLTTRSIIIAAGASPFVPHLPGLEETGYLTSDTLWDAMAQRDAAPRRLVILGGGPIGCELAQSFARLGSHVTVVEMAPTLLVREDTDVSDYALQVLRAEGVDVLLQHQAIRCISHNQHKTLLVEHGGQEHALAFDELICAVGRSARLQGYGLESLGITAERTLITDEYLATIYPNIFAAGDVAGPYQFTHTAAHQAWYATVNALFGNVWKFKADYRVIPATTFMDPEIARVGLNEKEAIKNNIAYEITRYGIDDLDRAILDGEAKGWVKVLTVPGKDKILGATIVGSHAGDLLTEFVTAMKYHLGLNKILGTIHAYPTYSEANKFAAGEWKRAHAPQTILNWLSAFHQRKLK